jgi:hypothetical protein
MLIAPGLASGPGLYSTVYCGVHKRPVLEINYSDAIAAAIRLAAFSPALCLIRPSLAAPRITSRDPSDAARMVTVTTAGLRFATPDPTMPATCLSRSPPLPSRSRTLPGRPMARGQAR